MTYIDMDETEIGSSVYDAIVMGVTKPAISNGRLFLSELTQKQCLDIMAELHPLIVVSVPSSEQTRAHAKRIHDAVRDRFQSLNTESAKAKSEALLGFPTSDGMAKIDLPAVVEAGAFVLDVMGGDEADGNARDAIGAMVAQLVLGDVGPAYRMIAGYAIEGVNR